MAQATSVETATRKEHEELGKEIQQALFKGNQAASLIMAATRVVLSLFSLSGEVFLRRKFGELYLSPLNVLLSALWFLALAAFVGFFAEGRGRFRSTVFMFGAPTTLTYIFLCVSLGLMVFHRYQTFRANWFTGEVIHGSSAGNSWLERFTWLQSLQKTLFFIPNFWQRYLEPIILLLVAVIFPDAFVRGWLICAGFALLMKEGLRSEAQRQAFVRLRDARVEADVMAEVAKVIEKAKTTGEIPEIPTVSKNGFMAQVPIEELIRLRNAKRSQADEAITRLGEIKPSRS